MKNIVSSFQLLFKKGYIHFSPGGKVRGEMSGGTVLDPERIQSKLEEGIAKEQARFRPKRGARDQIVNFRIILEKTRERNQPIYLCFVDFTKAFNMTSYG